MEMATGIKLQCDNGFHASVIVVHSSRLSENEYAYPDSIYEAIPDKTELKYETPQPSVKRNRRPENNYLTRTQMRQQISSIPMTEATGQPYQCGAPDFQAPPIPAPDYCLPLSQTSFSKSDIPPAIKF